MNYKLPKFKNKNYSKLSQKSFKKTSTVLSIIFIVIFIFICFEVYVPFNPGSNENVIFTIQKGWGENEIASNLYKAKIIRNTAFFKFYADVTLQHSSLQAGKYNLSPRMSTYQIVKRIAQGDVIKNQLLIFEGWGLHDIGKYLESKNICSEADFIKAASEDYKGQFDFLDDKPLSANLEGYLFPDTYEIADGDTCGDIVSTMLANFGKKLTPALRVEIAKQKKSIYDVVTMASILEKEVRTLDDKKIVSGILWKRLAIGMPLQLDSTVNYATGKSDASVSIKDTQVDSLYNTYKYTGLPKGPISNPGTDSITAAIYPIKTNYWFYLTDGKTIFSETLAQHEAAAVNLR